MKISCFNCGTRIDIVEKVGFRETCPSCDAWLHSCVHCRFWSGGHCTEPAAEKTGDPQARNFCEWYHGIEANSADEKDPAGTKDAAEDLWKKLTKK